MLEKLVGRMKLKGIHECDQKDGRTIHGCKEEDGVGRSTRSIRYISELHCQIGLIVKRSQI